MSGFVSNGRRRRDYTIAVTAPAAGEPTMPTELCPFCEHPRPPGARFCSACGGALHLAPCPHCGAVNDVSAASCFQCGRELAGQGADTVPVDIAGAESAPATARRARGPAWLAAAVAILGLLGALGYYALPTRTEVAPKAVPAPAREPPTEARPAQVDQGAITPVLPERPAAPPAATKAPVRKPRAPSTVRAAQATGTDACTAQALALGLCAEAAAAPSKPQAPAAQPPTPVTVGSCTQAAAALGLCAPESNDRGN